MERSADRRRTTHVIRQSWSPGCASCPYNTGWHLAHHVDMGVPWRNLPRLHAELVAVRLGHTGRRVPVVPGVLAGLLVGLSRQSARVGTWPTPSTPTSCRLSCTPARRRTSSRCAAKGSASSRRPAQTDAAAAFAKLAKPSVSAWAVEPARRAARRRRRRGRRPRRRAASSRTPAVAARKEIRAAHQARQDADPHGDRRRRRADRTATSARAIAPRSPPRSRRRPPTRLRPTRCVPAASPGRSRRRPASTLFGGLTRDRRRARRAAASAGPRHGQVHRRRGHRADETATPAGPSCSAPMLRRRSAEAETAEAAAAELRDRVDRLAGRTRPRRRRAAARRRGS